MKIGIIGYGVVGHALAESLKKKHELYIYDKNKRGAGLKDDITSLVACCEVIFICVPTPMGQSGAVQLTEVWNVVNGIEKLDNRTERGAPLTIAIKSTVEPGTTEMLQKEFIKLRFVFVPEFLTEGNADADMKNSNRIVIGGSSLKTVLKVKLAFKKVFPKATYLECTSRTAEMIKYAANVTLAGQVAIANEIYNICTALDIPYNEVRKFILLDDRIGSNTKVPGLNGKRGFGGKCFPKDLNALIVKARENGYRPYLLEEIWRSNLENRSTKHIDLEF